ncbi:MAG: YgjV family protein [Bacillota bacterium]|nr:YgjV family protein [Bacillota bacterium]
MSTLYFTIIVQAIGLLGVVCFIFSFQIKSNKALFLFQMAGSALFCFQYLLMGALSGCGNYLLAIIRNIMLAKMDKYEVLRWKGWKYIFSVISLVILVFTWQGPLSLLPTIALIAGSFGLWTDNAQKIRLCNLVAVSPAYLIYGIFAGSIGAVLNEIFVLSSIIISIFRYGWKAMGDNSFDK